MSYLDDFPELKHADIKVNAPTISLGFQKKEGSQEFEFIGEQNPNFKLNGKGFYLIKSVRIFSNLPRDVFSSIQPLISGFPSFNIKSSGGDQNINFSPIAFGDFGTQELNQEFNSKQKQNSTLEVSFNGPNFVSSALMSEYGANQFSVGVQFLIYRTNNKDWIKKYADIGTGHIK